MVSLDRMLSITLSTPPYFKALFYNPEIFVSFKPTKPNIKLTIKSKIFFLKKRMIDAFIQWTQVTYAQNKGIEY